MGKMIVKSAKFHNITDNSRFTTNHRVEWREKRGLRPQQPAAVVLVVGGLVGGLLVVADAHEDEVSGAAAKPATGFARQNAFS